jgi:hypothetical protein
VFKEHDILVNQICGGQGMCASCHFFVVEGSEALTAPTNQEQMTLQFTKIDRLKGLEHEVGEAAGWLCDQIGFEWGQQDAVLFQASVDRKETKKG